MRDATIIHGDCIHIMRHRIPARVVVVERDADYLPLIGARVDRTLAQPGLSL